MQLRNNGLVKSVNLLASITASSCCSWDIERKRRLYVSYIVVDISLSSNSLTSEMSLNWRWKKSCGIFDWRALTLCYKHCQLKLKECTWKWERLELIYLFLRQMMKLLKRTESRMRLRQKDLSWGGVFTFAGIIECFAPLAISVLQWDNTWEWKQLSVTTSRWLILVRRIVTCLLTVHVSSVAD